MARPHLNNTEENLENDALYRDSFFFLNYHCFSFWFLIYTNNLIVRFNSFL